MKKVRALLIAIVAMALLLGTMAVASAGTSDYTYYWMGKLNTTEKNATYLKAVGTVLVVYPDGRTPVVGTAAETLVKTNQVKAVVIAGVGSSSQGTAALAKTVAKAKNIPVAGITSGLGDSTIATEGSQGYYIGRSSNVAGVVYYEPASYKLAALFAAGARPTLLVGHSKGDMDVANALYKLKSEGRSAMFANTEFVTFGCGVYVPSGLRRFRQYLGNLDSLGMMNTVSYGSLTWVYGSYHTTNGGTYPWTYMPVEYYITK